MRPLPVVSRATGAALAVAMLSGCAAGLGSIDRAEKGPRGASARELGRAGFAAYLSRNDGGTAEHRFAEAVRRDPQDPWARLGASLMARRRLDDAAEVAQLLALVEGAPAHPLVPLAARRLGVLAELAPPRAREVEAGLAQVQPRLAGLAAARARAARAAAAAALGDGARAHLLRAQGGAITAFSLVGPFGGLHALEIDTRFEPEAGALPASAPAWGGLPPVPARPVSCPDGAIDLDAEPLEGDIFYLAADATPSRGGDYLLIMAGTSTLRAFVDGAPVAERRAYAGFPPVAQVVPISLAPGRHRLLVKIGRGRARAQLAVTLARSDGAPSDLAVAPAVPGEPAPAVHQGRLPRHPSLAEGLSEGLAGEMAPEVARWVVARDAMEGDREGAKALLEQALSRAPGSAPLLAARAEARRDDPTLSERIARARAEADLDQALAADPGDAASRLARVELAQAGERFDEASALLDRLSDGERARPRALLARARLALARGLSENAERLAESARRQGDSCAALGLLFDLSIRRDALARQDELAAALAECPGGRERLAEHRLRRGDLTGALAVAAELARAAPARVDIRMFRAGLLAAAGHPRAAADDMAELARTWPRTASIEKRRAEFLEAASDARGARAARERALLLDGADLALRRALAMEKGREPLDELDEDGARAIAAYRAARPEYATSSVTVLDFGAVEAHPGGSYTERIHTIVEARDQRGVDRVGEVAVPEGAELIMARTVKRDGRILEPENALGDKRTLSLAGLEPGDFAEWMWLRSVPGRGAAMPGFSAEPFYFRGDMPLWRSIYAGSAPAVLGIEVDAHHMPTPELREQEGRQQFRVRREAVPAVLPEPNAPAEAESFPFVQVGVLSRQGSFARAMADEMLEALRPSREVKALASEIEAALKPRDRGSDALLRAVYRRVNEVVLGQGGSFGEPAGAILSRGRGSRTVLLKSILDALGVKSRVALVRDFTRDPAPYRFSRPDLFGYAVLRVEMGGRIYWLDPTIRGTPFGVLPDPVRKAEALVLPAPGESVEVTETPGGGGGERRLARIHIACDGEGGALVDGVEEYRGFEAAALRDSIERLDPQVRRQAMEQVLSSSFRGPSLLEFGIEGERDVEAPLVVLRWRVRVERWARVEPGFAVADVPVLPARLGPRFLQRARRETALLLPADERSSLELRVDPPPGFKPKPNDPSTLESPFGHYRRGERLDKGTLVRKDDYDLLRSRISPADYPSFAQFAAAVDAAQERPMVFERSTQGK